MNIRRTKQKIEERVRLGTGQGDFWDTAMEKSDFEEGTGMTRVEMINDAFVLVIAATETTATLLSETIYLLLKHPEVMKKLQEEVRGAFKHEGEIDLLSVGKMDYMLAVLDEAMRIYPPVSNQGNRVVPPGGAMVAGKWVAGGVRSLSTVSLHVAIGNKSYPFSDPYPSPTIRLQPLYFRFHIPRILRPGALALQPTRSICQR